MEGIGLFLCSRLDFGIDRIDRIDPIRTKRQEEVRKSRRNRQDATRRIDRIATQSGDPLHPFPSGERY